jgi:endonuclease G
MRIGFTSLSTLIMLKTTSLLTWALAASLILLSPLHADDEHLVLGNPSAATTTDANNRLVEHPAFALSYNEQNGGANWVSWHLAQSDRGKSGRNNDFRPDPLLPATSQIRPNDYRGSGYDRGHLCPSGDRTADEELNSNTFLMSNMLPQTPDLNRQLWRKFEEYCRDQLRSGQNELYIVSGGVGSIERIGDGKVNVPASCWKVAVILPTGDDDLKRIDQNTRVVSVLMPNDTGPEIASGKWSDYITSVDKIEELTKLDLLSNLPKEVQTALESRIDTGRAPVRPTTPML